MGSSKVVNGLVVAALVVFALFGAALPVAGQSPDQYDPWMIGRLNLVDSGKYDAWMVGRLNVADKYDPWLAGRLHFDAAQALAHAAPLILPVTGVAVDEAAVSEAYAAAGTLNGAPFDGEVDALVAAPRAISASELSPSESSNALSGYASQFQDTVTLDERLSAPAMPDVILVPDPWQ